VLDRPEIPLHTNGSENDVRCHVTRRKVSGGTRSDVGRDCRDAFLGLAKTCAKPESRSGITSAQDWLSQAARPSHTCRNWSPPNPDRPDRPEVRPYYEFCGLLPTYCAESVGLSLGGHIPLLTGAVQPSEFDQHLPRSHFSRCSVGAVCDRCRCAER
jgi:hypothetical protein